MVDIFHGCWGLDRAEKKRAALTEMLKSFRIYRYQANYGIPVCIMISLTNQRISNMINGATFEK